MSAWAVAAWILVAALAAVVATTVAGSTGHAAVAVAQDGLPYLLVVAWAVLVAALVGRSWGLVLAAAVLAGYHLRLLYTRLRRNRAPAWVAQAPRLTLTVANVFVDNEQPETLAAVLLGSAADVIVIAEWNEAFARAFDRAGGAAAYPHRLLDPSDRSDYAVSVVARLPLLEGSAMVTSGPLTVAHAVVQVSGRRVTIVGLNPMAVVDPDGYATWDAQVDELIAHVGRTPGPLVVAGDLNSTTVRPKLRQLLALGLDDAHELLGSGLSRSFKLAADGPAAAVGTVARLDHVLVDHLVRPVTLTDLASGGSDHVPFVAELAVATPAASRSGAAGRAGRRGRRARA